MTKRFENMVKVPKEPAARMLAHANVSLKTPIESPVSALPQVVLEELDGKGALIDMLRMLSVVLPARERVWWACLAARDVLELKAEKPTPSLATAEAWVFKPSIENREAARATMDNAYVDDDTTLCALCTIYADGTMGPGDLEKFPSPAGAAEAAAFGMNAVALGEHSDRFEEYGQMLIDRAVDIARGGNGRLEHKKLQEQEG